MTARDLETKESPDATGVLVGIFAGGAGSRMGGIDKGGLLVPGGGSSIIEHQVTLVDALGLPCVLLGAREAWAMRLPQCSRLADQPLGIGPLGGLSALLAHAQNGHVITLACDMPHVDEALLARLLRHPKRAAVLAPQDAQTGKWQPLCARYEVQQVRPVLQAELARGTRSFQRLLAALPVERLELTSNEALKLRDWDTPEDLART